MDGEMMVAILREIRDEIRNTRGDLSKRIDETNARLEQTNARLEQTNARLEDVRDELGRRIVESEMRTASAITDLAGAVHSVRDLLRDRLDLRDRVDRCEHEIEIIKQRLAT
ncbi:MAG: hypothetical protein HYY06_27505 [Deltaproteobacteria bacterium]|nr:hypothetical protein [Deltaproteobacteria bacterium]